MNLLCDLCVSALKDETLRIHKQRSHFLLAIRLEAPR
jgi:hypothetical protein